MEHSKQSIVGQIDGFSFNALIILQESLTGGPVSHTYLFFSQCDGPAAAHG